MNQENNQSIKQSAQSTDQQPTPQPTDQPQSFISKLKWKYIGIGIAVVLVVGVGAVWVGNRPLNSPSQIPIPSISQPLNDREQQDELYCEKDEDCACGIKINTGDCFYGNKKYVNTVRQCPDFCTGFANNYRIKCNNNKCTRVGRPTISPTSQNDLNWQTINYHNFSMKLPLDFYLERQSDDTDVYSQSQKTGVDQISIMVSKNFMSWSSGKESVPFSYASKEGVVNYTEHSQKTNGYAYIKGISKFEDNNLRDNILFYIQKPNTDNCISFVVFTDNNPTAEQLAEQIINTLEFK